MEATEGEHTAKMLLMRGQGVEWNQYVVKVDESKQKISKDLVHHSLEGLGSVPKAKREAEKFKEYKGSNDGGLRNISGPHRNLEITLLEVKFGKDLGTGDSGGEIKDSEERVSIWDHGDVEAVEVLTRSPGPIRLRYHVKGAPPAMRRKDRSRGCSCSLRKHRNQGSGVNQEPVFGERIQQED